MILAGTATSGRFFRLALRPDAVKGARRTVVSIVWERGEDEELRRTVLKARRRKFLQRMAQFPDERDSSGR